MLEWKSKLFFIFVLSLSVSIVLEPNITVDASSVSENPLALHSNFLVSNYTVLTDSNFTLNNTNYFIVRENYIIGFFSGDNVISKPANRFLANTNNSYTIENNQTLQVKVIKYYSYVKESEYIKKMNLSEITNLESSISNFSAIADPIANYSCKILDVINDIYNERVTYSSVNVSFFQVIQEVDPELATAIGTLKSATQTVYSLSQPLDYCGNEIIYILNKIEPELGKVINGGAVPNSNINSNLIELSVDTSNYRNYSSKVYDFIDSYQNQIQSFLSVPETGIDVGILPNLLASIDSSGSALIQGIHNLLGYPLNSMSSSTRNVSRQSNEAVSTQNSTFVNTYNSVKYEAAVPYIVEYLQFFIISVFFIVIISALSKIAGKRKATVNGSKKKIASNLLILGVTNIGATVSLLSLLYLFNLMPGNNILYSFFPMYDGVKQSTADVLSQSGSLSSLPITWIIFLIFSLLGGIIFIWYSITSHGHLSTTLKIYKAEEDSATLKTRSPISTFLPGLLIVMEIILIVSFIENPQVMPGSVTLFFVFVLFGYFIFSIIFPLGITSMGRKLRSLGKFSKNSAIRLAGTIYIAGIMLIYSVAVLIMFYLADAYVNKRYPNLNFHIYVFGDILFYSGIFLLLVAPIILLYGSRVVSHRRTEAI